MCKRKIDKGLFEEWQGQRSSDFHCPFTDIEALGDFVIRQTFLTAHPVYFASLGRHALDRTVDDRLQLADEQGFFL